MKIFFNNEIEENSNSKEFTPQQVAILSRLFDLGESLLYLLPDDILQHYGKHFAMLGSEGVRSIDIVKKLPLTVIEEIEAEAAEDKFILDRDDWRRIVISALNLAGFESGYRWTTDEIVFLKENYFKYTDAELAKLLPGRTPEAIETWRLKNDLRKAPLPLNRDKVKQKKVTELWDQGKSTAEISTETGIKVRAIRRFLSREGLTNRVDWDIEKENVKRLYLAEGKKVSEVANHYGVSTATIARALRKFGFKKDPSDDDIKQMAALAREGHSYAEISDKVGYSEHVARQSVRKELKALGLEIENKIQWTNKDDSTFLALKSEGANDADIAAILNRPLKQISSYRFYLLSKEPLENLQNHDWLTDKEKDLVRLAVEQGIYHEFAIYLNDDLGFTPPEIVDMFKFTDTSGNLIKALKNYKVNGFRLEKYPMTDHIKKRIIDLSRQGISRKDIARLVSRPLPTINSFLRQVDSES